MSNHINPSKWMRSMKIKPLDDYHILFIVEFVNATPTREDFEYFEDYVRIYLQGQGVYTWGGFFNRTKFDTILAHKEEKL